MRSRDYLLLAALEGSTVVCVEILGAKLLSPVLGSSVYVWSFMLAVTLAALATGYFTGGWISEKRKAADTIPLLFLLASIFIVLMPFMSSRIFYYLGELTFFPLLAIQTIAVLFIPLFLLGITSPMLVHGLAEHHNFAPGRIFTASTAAGIFSGLLVSFVLVPFKGVSFSIILWSALLAIASMVTLQRSHRIYVLFFIAVAFLSMYSGGIEERSFRGKQLFHQNGVLGDIQVVEFEPYDTSLSKTASRWLFVNNISQTMHDPGADEKYFTYAYRIRALLDTLPNGSDVLLCGLGGGSIVTILGDKKFSIDVCELDERMPVIAKKYFDLPDEQQVNIDDARHFIRTAKKKYDAIILDVFRGEETPNHVMSMEGLSDLKKILEGDGILIVNSHGYLTGPRGDGNRAVYRTLSEAGFNVSAEFTDEKEEMSNILFSCALKQKIAVPAEIAFEKFSGGEVLTDQRPRLEKLNRQASLAWRIDAKKILLRDVRSAYQ